MARVIGSIIICASQNIGMLIVGRFINGFCVGICSAQVPVYISELAPPSKRGRLGYVLSESHPFSRMRVWVSGH